jgi:hypothetical protein
MTVLTAEDTTETYIGVSLDKIETEVQRLAFVAKDHTTLPAGLDVPGSTSTIPTGAIGKGSTQEVVGYEADGPTTYGFIEQAGTYWFIDVGNSTDTKVLGITAKGVIFGTYVNAAGQTEGFKGYNDTTTRGAHVINTQTLPATGGFDLAHTG